MCAHPWDEVNAQHMVAAAVLNGKAELETKEATGPEIDCKFRIICFGNLKKKKVKTSEAYAKKAQDCEIILFIYCCVTNYLNT